MNADGSDPHPLTSGRTIDLDPSLSPDGKKIAFSSEQGGTSHIYVINADGSGETSVTNGPGDDNYPESSPDGSRILFASWAGPLEHGLYVMDCDGSGLTRLADSWSSMSSLSWSPDGTRIAFARSGNDICVMKADGSEYTRWTDLPEAKGYYPSWTPDGSRILYSNSDGIYLMRPDGTEQVTIAGSKASLYAIYAIPNFSPDGSKIAFFSMRVDTLPSGMPLESVGIHVMDADGSNEVLSATGGMSYSWSPDSTAIVFEMSGQIWRSNAYGSGLTQLTYGPGQNQSPVWSPTP